MVKTVLFLADGMADEPLSELGGKTPLEHARTPNMDLIARGGACGSFLSLPEGFPTSSDVANMSVLGYELEKYYPGRGPLEAVSQGIDLKDDHIAWRCNLVHVDKDVLIDYSANHIGNEQAKALFNDLQKVFGNDKIEFHSGVSYRNLLVMKGKEFSTNVNYFKPDSHQGERVDNLRLSPMDGSPEAARTVEFMEDLCARCAKHLAAHPLNVGVQAPANAIWPYSPGHRPAMPAFSQKYAGAKGAVISAVDVIFGLAICAGMDVVKVPGATGFVDTNYEGKAKAAIDALRGHDFVYLHVEAIDEASHIGDLNLKIKAIEDFDSRIVGPVMKALAGQKITFAVLPDHPVPVKLRKHTRTPVPVAAMGPRITPDQTSCYCERCAPEGGLGHMCGDQLVRRLLDLG